MTQRTLFAAGLLLATLPLHAGGFEIDAQGARSAGMAGACVAQASDPTAVFCNPGALALIPKKKGSSVGISTSAFNESLYQGLPPGVGAGTASRQTTPRTNLPHAFLALPVRKHAVFGIGYYHPFRMQTEWAAPDQFAGRFVATSSMIEAYDITPVIALHAGDKFGIGGGAIYRTSSISSARRLSTLFAGTQPEIASLSMNSDSRHSLGWTAGLLIHPTPAVSLGASYRSRTRKTGVSGVGRLTQIPTGNAQLDQLVATTLPFGQDLLVTTTSEFPAQMKAGIALTPIGAILLEADAEKTAWKKLHNVTFTFPSAHTFDTTYALSLRDTWTYRGGFRFRFPTGPQLRLGYAVTKSPLPDTAVGAFFPDSNRTTMTIGAGLDWIDLAFGVTTYKQRIVTNSATGLNGNYRAKSWFAVMTVTK